MSDKLHFACQIIREFNGGTDHNPNNIDKAARLILGADLASAKDIDAAQEALDGLAEMDADAETRCEDSDMYH